MTNLLIRGCIKNLKYNRYLNIINQKKIINLKTTEFDKLFPLVKLPKPLNVEIPDLHKPSIKTIISKTLLLEVLTETGAGGTQVQIPIHVINEFFKVSTTGHQTIELKFGSNEFRPAVVCHFQNNTHRITLPELENIDRPVLTEFVDLGKKCFHVRIITGKEYEKLIKLCKNNTRYNSKKWVITDKIT